MKVLIVHRYMSYYGGAENVVKELSENLSKNHIENSVITLNSSPELSRLYQELDFIKPKKDLPNIFRSTGFLPALGIFRELFWLRKLIKENYKKFDVINIHNFPAEWAVYGINKPIVWMCNEPPDLYSNPNPSLLLELCRFFGIAVDRFMVRNFVDEICAADGINAERVLRRYGRRSHIVPYGIDVEVFDAEKNSSETVNSRYGLEQNEFVLLQVGVISPQKNQLESVKALEKLLGTGARARLILAGKEDGPYKAKLDEYINKQGLGGRVIFTGFVDKKSVSGLYHRADICLFPVKEQGGWLAPFEALVCRKPVIVSETMGAAELIKENSFGIVTDDFPGAVVAMKNDIAKYKAAAERASGWVRENLTWKNYTNKMTEVFGLAQKEN